MAPVLKIFGGSLGTGKRGTVPNIWCAVPILLARVNGVSVAIYEVRYFVFNKIHCCFIRNHAPILLLYEVLIIPGIVSLTGTLIIPDVKKKF